MADTAGSNQGRKRKERRDKGRKLINERDLKLLPWVGEQYAVRLDQLQKLLGRSAGRQTLEPGIVSESTALRVVERWKALGFVESEKFFVNEPIWVWLTRNGLRQLGLSYRYWTPTVAALKHLYWLNQVRLFIERGRQEVTWRGERDLRRERGKKSFHYADAEVIRVNGVTIGVEVEITRKRPERIVTIMEQLSGRYEGVWYFTNDQTHSTVTSSLSELPDNWQKKFRVISLEEVA